MACYHLLLFSVLLTRTPFVDTLDQPTPQALIADEQKLPYSATTRRGRCTYEAYKRHGSAGPLKLVTKWRIEYVGKNNKYRYDVEDLLATNHFDTSGKVFLAIANRFTIIYDGTSSLKAAYNDHPKLGGSSVDITTDLEKGRFAAFDYGFGLRPDRPYGVFFALNRKDLRLKDFDTNRITNGSGVLLCRGVDDHTVYDLQFAILPQYLLTEVTYRPGKDLSKTGTIHSFMWGSVNGTPVVKRTERTLNIVGNETDGLTQAKYVLEYESQEFGIDVDDGAFKVDSLKLRNGSKMTVRGKGQPTQVLYYNTDKDNKQEIRRNVANYSASPDHEPDRQSADWYVLARWCGYVIGGMLLIAGLLYYGRLKRAPHRAFK